MNSYDLFIAGYGLTGTAAALFAARQELTVLQAGSPDIPAFYSGLLDIYDAPDPWLAIESVAGFNPHHPYARMLPENVYAAMEIFLEWLAGAGLVYRHNGRSSVQLLTPAGTFKSTWGVPASMWAGVEAGRRRAPTLVVGFEGFREFSALQVAQGARAQWPALDAVTIEFPGSAGEKVSLPLSGMEMAAALDCPQRRFALIRKLQRVLTERSVSYTSIGLPAVLGLNAHAHVYADLESSLGMPVFEIPTLLPSPPGARLKKAFLCQAHPQYTPRPSVQALEITPQEEGFLVSLGRNYPEEGILARSVLLATGRFLSKGLWAERGGICEPIMDLPVFQPGNRRFWHDKSFFAPGGHMISRAGLMTNERLQPIDFEGELIHPQLYAAGSILSQQDWIREKCGAGMAIATAWLAIEAIRESRH